MNTLDAPWVSTVANRTRPWLGWPLSLMLLSLSLALAGCAPMD